MEQVDSRSLSGSSGSHLFTTFSSLLDLLSFSFRCIELADYPLFSTNIYKRPEPIDNYRLCMFFYGLYRPPFFVCLSNLSGAHPFPPSPLDWHFLKIEKKITGKKINFKIIKCRVMMNFNDLIVSTSAARWGTLAVGRVGCTRPLTQDHTRRWVMRAPLLLAHVSEVFSFLKKKRIFMMIHLLKIGVVVKLFLLCCPAPCVIDYYYTWARE